MPDAISAAAFSNDVVCHIGDRARLLTEVCPVLKPGTGRFLFSDALAVGGLISKQEMAERSSIGFYVFSPPGDNERLLREAGFCDVEVQDTTERAAGEAERWHGAREKQRDELITIEGLEKFDGLQRFLWIARTLMAERRLLRLLYQARRP